MSEPTPTTNALPPPPQFEPATPLRDRLVRARAMLLFVHPFLGYLVNYLEDRLGASDVAASRTDGELIEWRDEYLAALTPHDLMFVLAHHALHCALGHPWSAAGREPVRWRDACDALVNEQLIEMGLAAKTSRALDAQRVRVLRPGSRPTVERLYQGAAQWPRPYYVPEQRLASHERWASGATPTRRERDLADRWRFVLTQASKFGKVPTCIAREVDAIVAPRRDWRDLLREGLFWQADYTFTPTDRRLASVLVPTLQGEIRRVVIAIDLRHPWRDGLRVFWGEALSILRNNHCEAWVVAFDGNGIHAAWDGWSFEDAMVSDALAREPVLCGSLAEFVEGRCDAGWEPDGLVCLTPLVALPTGGEPRVERVIWLVPPVTNAVYARQQPAPPYGELIVFDAN